ncbi:MAG: hypothetical protein A2046_13120 [Bacteroidetes bacterium GWA2_30_7]|nr:MAG: hypothetical protein A2046_13120 [Bacteroidetes bacterium GWA2_30_7]
MIKSVVIIFVIYSSLAVFGQNNNGYYINNSGDTVNVSFKIPIWGGAINFVKIQKSIKFTDQNGTTVIIKPDSVILFTKLILFNTQKQFKCFIGLT